MKKNVNHNVATNELEYFQISVCVCVCQWRKYVLRNLMLPISAPKPSALTSFLFLFFHFHGL